MVFSALRFKDDGMGVLICSGWWGLYLVLNWFDEVLVWSVVLSVGFCVWATEVGFVDGLGV